jgi:DNA-nicking Smr family endonuclease
MTGRRFLTEEERALWQQITQHDSRFDDKRRYTDPTPSKLAKPKVRTRGYERLQAPQGTDFMPLSLGDYAGIDHHTAARFRTGEKPIDGLLDLHGMTVDRAHHVLVDFVHQHHARGSRVLLIITGKGMRQCEDGLQGFAPRGVLRTALPEWLATPDLRHLILAVDHAAVKHGGTGAYYVLLKRQRGKRGKH